MLFSSLYSSFLLIKPTAVQYQLSIPYHWSNYTLSFFHVFRGENKAREHVSNQIVQMCSSKVM